MIVKQYWKFNLPQVLRRDERLRPYRSYSDQFVPLGTIDQRRNLNVHEGLWGQEALPHVAFKYGREVRKQGGASELV